MIDKGRIQSRELFLDLLNKEVKRARRYKYSFCILKITVSNLSGIENGKYAQECFQNLIQFTEKELRESDIPGLLGEYQIGIILFATDPNKAVHAQARLEKRFKRYRLKEEPCEVKVEHICFPTDVSTINELIKRLANQKKS